MREPTITPFNSNAATASPVDAQSHPKAGTVVSNLVSSCVFFVIKVNEVLCSFIHIKKNTKTKKARTVSCVLDYYLSTNFEKVY